MKLLALLAAITSVLAQNFYITSPVTGTSFNANDNAELKWNLLDSPSMADAVAISIDLVNGDANAASLVVNIVENLKADARAFSWKVPGNLKTGEDYFLRMWAVNANGQRSYNYSSRFKIVGGSGSAPAPAPISDNKNGDNKDGDIKADAPVSKPTKQSSDASSVAAGVTVSGIAALTASLLA